MILSNNIEIKNEAIAYNLKRLTNQIYKLLPNREENIFPLLCKLEGLHSLTGEDDFFQYRRTIFECLNLIQILKDSIEEE